MKAKQQKVGQNQMKDYFAPQPIEIDSWKRVLDVVLIFLALPFLIPIAMLVTLFIRCGSTGPVLFSQERIGFQGRRFKCYKFRTMFVDADTATHQEHLHQLMSSNIPMHKMDSDGDPRIVPFGVLIRASGLDELPQLINVLWGEMSLVGPRPCLPYEYDRYLPWQKKRFETAPGLTGLWQVSGKNKTTFVEMIQLDIKYAKNKSLLRDVKIILMTAPILVIQMLEARLVKKPPARPMLQKVKFPRQGGQGAENLRKKSRHVPENQTEPKGNRLFAGQCNEQVFTWVRLTRSSF